MFIVISRIATMRLSEDSCRGMVKGSEKCKIYGCLKLFLSKLSKFGDFRTLFIEYKFVRTEYYVTGYERGVTAEGRNRHQVYEKCVN